MATLEQKRASFALKMIDWINNTAGQKPSKYKTELRKLPGRLHNIGLGQTIAFLLSEGPGKPEWHICEWLEDWLATEDDPGIYPPNIKLIRCVSGEDEKLKDLDAELLYRRASEEARALSVWLKRFAEAFLVEERGQ